MNYKYLLLIFLYFSSIFSKTPQIYNCGIDCNQSLDIKNKVLYIGTKVGKSGTLTISLIAGSSEGYGFSYTCTNEIYNVSPLTLSYSNVPFDNKGKSNYKYTYVVEYKVKEDCTYAVTKIEGKRDSEGVEVKVRFSSDILEKAFSGFLKFIIYGVVIIIGLGLFVTICSCFCSKNDTSAPAPRRQFLVIEI